nr:ORF6 [Serpentovirales sp.]
MSIARLFKKPSYHCHHNSIAASMFRKLTLRKSKGVCKHKDDCKFLEYQDKSTQTNFEDYFTPPSPRSIRRGPFNQLSPKFFPKNPRPLGRPSHKHFSIASVRQYRERLI